MKIVQVIADWFYTNDGEGWDSYEVGKNDVIKIIENKPRGEGDKWYYDIHYTNGRMERLFNPNSVSYEE